MKAFIAIACLFIGASYGLALSGCAQAIATTVNQTATWIVPTLNTDGSAITDPLTYNVYGGAAGKEVLLKSGVTTATYIAATTAGTVSCMQVTSVVDSIESARTPEVCVTPSFPVPSAPTGLTLK